MESDSRCSFAWNLHTTSTRSSIPRQTAACSGLVEMEISTRIAQRERAELFGIASALKFLLEFIKFHEIDTSSLVTIWTDSAAAFAQVRFLTWSKHTGCPPANEDIVSALKAEFIHTLVKVKLIKSHQNKREVNGTKLTTSATLDIVAEATASNFLARCPNEASGGPRQNSPHYPTMQASPIIATSRIHTTGTAAQMRQYI